ncbi:MAG: hypothetical protein HON90_07150, partial [Halobacteriovoraceae bacterium]|nr:hypothetical protein [Halobacteriovoraceae bacterium]
YESVKLKLRNKNTRKVTTEFKLSYGKRESDDLTKTEGSVGFIYHRFLNKNKNAHASFGYRENFTSKDILARFGIGSFSNKWEYSLDQEIILEEEEEARSGAATVTELAATHLYSKTLFTTFSFQYARDEKVDIYSTFFKMTYRFGNREIAPLRDGAPAQGKL